MKLLMKWFSLAGMLACLALINRATPLAAQENRGGESFDRLERLERQIQELAQRQEQMMRRLESQAEHSAPRPQLGGGDPGPRLQPPGGSGAGPHNMPGARRAKGLHDLLGLLFVIGVLCNILLAIWIFTDIRKRGEGSGIFIAMALVAGIPAAIIYSLVRLGDKKS